MPTARDSPRKCNATTQRPAPHKPRNCAEKKSDQRTGGVMLVVLAAEALRALGPFQLAVDDHGGVLSNVKCPMLLKDVPLLISRHSRLQTSSE